MDRLNRGTDYDEPQRGHDNGKVATSHFRSCGSSRISPLSHDFEAGY